MAEATAFPAASEATSGVSRGPAEREKDSDIGGGERRGGHLVQQRLEEVVVFAVDQRNAHGVGRERAGGVQAPEAAADDDDVGRLGPAAVGACGHGLDPQVLSTTFRRGWSVDLDPSAKDFHQHHRHLVPIRT